MTTMRCENCKHWEDMGDVEYPIYIGVGRCKRVKMFWDSTEWKEIEYQDARVLKAESINDKAFVQDGSDYHATLITRPDFGCVQYEAQIDVI